MGRRRKSELNKSFMTNSNDSSDSSAQASTLNGQQRKAANDRERTRMRVLSKAFVRLKTSLPWVPNDTKLSKLDTLKLAASYIAYLTRILEEDDGAEFEDMGMYEDTFGNEINNINNNSCNSSFSNFYQLCHQSSKMLSCITLASLDTQRSISEHLAASNQNFYNHQNMSFNVA
jgi:hypothetical protein